MKATLLLLTSVLATASLIAVEPVAELMQRIMKAADKNRDGKLSLEEYRPLDVQAKHHGDEHFAAGDTNQSGLIEAGELAGVLHKQTWFAILNEGIEVSFARLDAQVQE
jgi:Ca2+-binding EF-hand superfamily protein